MSEHIRTVNERNTDEQHAWHWSHTGVKLIHFWFTLVQIQTVCDFLTNVMVKLTCHWSEMFPSGPLWQSDDFKKVVIIMAVIIIRLTVYRTKQASETWTIH